MMYSDSTGTFAITAILIGALIGGLISGAFAIAGEVKQYGWDASQWNWKQIVLSTIGGAVAGAITALPVPGFSQLGAIAGKIASYGVSFLMGSIGSVVGGLISGSVTIDNPKSIIMAIVIGGIANVAARGITDIIANVKASNIFNQSNKAKSLDVQKLQGHPLNIGKDALKGNMRNAFKGATKADIIELLWNANPWLRNGIYSGISSSLLSGWY